MYFFSFLRWFDLPSVALSAMALINPADVFPILVVKRLNTGASGFTSALEDVNLSSLVLVCTLFV